jgi:hypothetical protein
VAVRDRLFTREEVNALLPELTEIMGEVMERHRQAQALGQELEEERRHIQMSGGTRVDQRDWKARAERLDGLGIEVRQGIERIHGLGGTVKGLDPGLVDFPGLVAGQGDEPVNLCWKHGETAVRFWHGFNEGYAQRKPLP